MSDFVKKIGYINSLLLAIGSLPLAWAVLGLLLVSDIREDPGLLGNFVISVISLIVFLPALLVIYFRLNRHKKRTTQT